MMQMSNLQTERYQSGAGVVDEGWRQRRGSRGMEEGDWFTERDQTLLSCSTFASNKVPTNIVEIDRPNRVRTKARSLS